MPAKTIVAGLSGVLFICLLSLAYRLRPTIFRRPVMQNKDFWALILLCFGISAAFFWEFHGVIFYSARVFN